MRLVALLDQLAGDGDAGRAQQLLELGEVALRAARPTTYARCFARPGLGGGA